MAHNSKKNTVEPTLLHRTIYVRRVIEPLLNFKIGSIGIAQMELDKKSAETQKRADSFKNSIKEFLNTQFQVFDKKSESEENPMYYYAT